VPVITTALILGSILVSGRIDEFNKHIDQKGNDIANYLSPISEYGIFSNNFTYLNTTLEHTLKQHDIVAVYIVNNQNIVVLKKTSDKWPNFDLNKIDKNNNKIFTSAIVKTSVQINDLETDPEKKLDSHYFVGVVNVVMNLENARMTKSRIIKNSIMVILISTLVTIFIALLFARSVTKPITLINAGVKIIKQGALSYRLPVNFSGELAELAQGINNMTSSLESAQFNEKQRAENELLNEKTKAQITLDAIGEGVITTDTNGRITYLNPTAEKLTGFSLNEAIGKYLSTIFKIKHKDDNVFSNYSIMKKIQLYHNSNDALESILTCNDGTEYTIKETATPLLDKDDKLMGAVLVFHDVSHIK
jgi:PAS domain S-box-containing protein